MKITYLINQVQPDGSTRLSAVSVDEWRSAIRENEGLPPERQRYFIRDYIADKNDMDCMVIEVSASEYGAGAAPSGESRSGSPGPIGKEL